MTNSSVTVSAPPYYVRSQRKALWERKPPPGQQLTPRNSSSCPTYGTDRWTDNAFCPSLWGGDIIIIIIISCVRGDTICIRLLTLPYLTLPYGEDVLPPSAEASNGPNAHPKINRKVTKCPRALLTWILPTLGTIPLPSEGLLIGPTY